MITTNNKPYQVHIGGRLEVLPQEILMFQGENNYTIVHFLNGRKTTVATVLKTLESRLSPDDFFRIHKSYIVNLHCIQKYSQNIKGYSVRLINEQILTVSRRRRVRLKKCLKLK